MEQGAEQDKSEQATPYKLSKARQRGSVARGADLAFLTTVGCAGVLLWLGGSALAEQLATVTRRALVAASTVDSGPSAVLTVSGMVLSAVTRPILVVAVVLFAVVLFVEFLQTGPVFSSAALRFDFNRLNPAQNLKRVFALRMLIETAKNVLKIAAYAGLAYGVFHYAREILAASLTDAAGLAEGLRRIAVRLLFAFAAGAAAFALLDQIIVRREFAKKMRMSRRETRRESRDREGDPRIKQRRKQLHAEFVKLSQSVKNIRGADLLIVNPTHFAVALRYDRATMAAPRVVSRGANQVALRLKRLAFVYGVVIVENPILARALYQRCALNSQIPDQFYQTVADLYLAIRAKQRGDSSNGPHV